MHDLLHFKYTAHAMFYSEDTHPILFNSLLLDTLSHNFNTNHTVTTLSHKTQNTQQTPVLDLSLTVSFTLTLHNPYLLRGFPLAFDLATPSVTAIFKVNFTIFFIPFF